jgi:NAD-dependent dihydropyrimidine dehydrogenase PreA subunit
MITEDCVNCGACERMCPSGGISRGDEVFMIDPDRCSECVGFHHTQQCARVCPVDCCVIDPNNVETEAVLFERAQRWHAGSGRTLRLGPETSHHQARRRSFASTLRHLGRRLEEALGPSLPA